MSVSVRVHIDYAVSRYWSRIRRPCDIAMPTCRTTSCTNAHLTRALLAGTDRIRSTNTGTYLGQHAVRTTMQNGDGYLLRTAISERPWLDSHSAAGRYHAVQHACSVLPLLVVPGLVGPPNISSQMPKVFCSNFYRPCLSSIQQTGKDMSSSGNLP